MIDKKKVKYAICTLFDSNYIDKGLVLYDSLEKNASNYTLYVLAMNEKCYEILTDMNNKHLVVIKLSDFENEDLLRVKPTRSIGEYCWTCGSSLIKYIFDTYTPDYCSYVDADMAFYDDPFKLVEELESKNASVSIVGHRYDWFVRETMCRKVGEFCVECNTFKNDAKGLNLLDIWISQCVNYCSIDGDGLHWGDQKYMDNWLRDYDFVIETSNLGAGVAPWNISQYKLLKIEDNGDVIISCKGYEYKLLFFHFENLKFLDLNIVDIGVYNTWGISGKLVDSLYKPYLHKIVKKKSMLWELYGVSVLIKQHPEIRVVQANPYWKQVLNLLSSKKRLLLFIFRKIPSNLYHKKNLFYI